MQAASVRDMLWGDMRILSCLALLAGAALAQTSPPNPVKAALLRGEAVVGMTITVPSADVALQGCNLGFDFLWIEMEHSPITLESARNMVLATRGSRTVPFIRVPVNELWTAKRALDAGALGVMFPFTSTPELARQAVAAIKYPPQGRRGAGPGLATARWPAPEGYANFADANTMAIVIIETVEAIEKIEEIASVPGIDVLFIGTNDLSYSMGLRGRTDDPRHREALEKVLAAGRKHKIPVGRPASAAQIPEFLKQGYRFFQASSELAFIGAGARPILDALGKQAPSAKERPIY